MTNKEFSNKQIDTLLNSHPEVLQIWKGFEIIGRPCWQRANVCIDRGAVCVPLTDLRGI